MSKQLIDGGADARYVATGHLLYVREGELLAVPFDVERLEVTGGPIGVVPDVMQAAYLAGLPNDTGAMQVSVSATGTLVYLTGGTHQSTEYEVLQLDRDGRGDTAADSSRRLQNHARLARRDISGPRHGWPGSRHRALQLRARNGRQVDSRQAAAMRRSGRVMVSGSPTPLAPRQNNLHWARADGGGPSELLVTSPLNLVPAAWTPGDRHFFYYSIQSEAVGQPTVWVQDRVDRSEPRAVYRALPNGGGVDVSPDGRWVAYHSAESGRMEVYVDAFPGPGPHLQVSTTGGGSPVWRADGRELFYARPSREGQARGAGAADVDIMAVTVTTQPTPIIGPPRRLFSGRYSMNNPDRGYDVSPDGERFVMLQARPRTPDVITGMIVVQNWTEELRRLDRAR